MRGRVRGIAWLCVVWLLSVWWPAAAQLQEVGVVAQLLPSLGTVSVYNLPDASMPPQLQLNGGTFVTVVGRNTTNDWFNIQVPGSVGGWLPANQITILASNFDHNALPLIPVDEDTILGYSLLWNFETNHNLVIFQRGRQSGKQLNGIAKVGDSITASRMYLHPFADGVYDLQAYPHLEHVLDFFGTTAESPFAQQSMAVYNGWSTRDVLSEGRAAQRGCPPGTTPLTCEYNSSQPAFALIMLGTNDAVVMTAAEFEENLKIVVETTLAYDIVPILFTVPPNQRPNQDVAAFNRAVVRVAQVYDISMVNYWLAMQTLPNKGISSDLIHPSGPPSNAGTTLFTPEYLQYGYTVRNLVTLQGLDLLLRNTVYPAFG